MPAATLNDALEIENWRRSLAATARRAIADSRAGRLKGCTAGKLISRLRKQWEAPDE
jgi:hypothetical protein